MGREIKFRAFDNVESSMIYKGLKMLDFIGRVHEHTGEFSEYNRYSLMQYTGLKDKYGIEIYEGDIVSHEFYNHSTPNVKFKQECYFDNGCFCLRTIGKEQFPIEQDRNNVPIFWCLAPNVIEVIGDIHQNPELL